ncbi:putative glycerol-3-phosphate transporter 2 isoform X3 [Patiria miniata]|uniref:Major facilitator superfamily (MFS) profile domain-containing protein n=1 Tax=Patiria miniata TaxID=46514 RepID=A0A914AUT8_PATMI|nr:putative glycerol-3-phosphate transporter 2 isoform X3 [Patiria miniata]
MWTMLDCWKCFSSHSALNLQSRMQLKHHQACIFALTWTAYAGTYLLRKPLAVVKTDLSNELSMTRTDLGWLDTAMLFPYAAVQIVFGSSADKYGARRTLAVCLMTSAMSMASFGLWHSFYIYAVLLFINGAAQVHLQTRYGWRDTFFIPSFILGGIGLMVLMFLHSPSDLQVVIPGKDLESAVSEKLDPATPSFVSLWKLPMLKEVAISVFCIKIVRYCMFMWLPMYLHQQLHYGKAGSGMLPTSFEIGGVLGSASLGYLIQRFLRGQMLLGSGLAILASTLSLVCFLLTASWGAVPNFTLMLIAGAFNCGVDPILSGSVPSELGELDGRKIQASVSGFVNGFGSLGTVLQGPIVGAITEYYGWSGMLYLIITLSLLGCLASLKGYLIGTGLRLNGTTQKLQMGV